MVDFQVVLTHLDVKQVKPDGSYWLFKCPPYCHIDVESEGFATCRLWADGSTEVVEGTFVEAD